MGGSPGWAPRSHRPVSDRARLGTETGGIFFPVLLVPVFVWSPWVWESPVAETGDWVRGLRFFILPRRPTSIVQVSALRSTDGAVWTGDSSGDWSPSTTWDI